MLEKTLEQIGLTKSEARVYLALLDIGTTSSGPIINKSGVSRSKVYELLEKLTQKGLVTTIISNNQKMFTASSPENILTYIQNKKNEIINEENEFKQILPQLLKKQKFKEQEQKATVYYGWKGIYNAFNFTLEILPTGEEYIGFAAGTGEQYSEQSKRFFEQFQKKRSEKKYKVKLISNEENRKTLMAQQYSKTTTKPDFRFVDGIALTGMIIFGDYTLRVSLTENPVAILTKSKQIADINREFFYNMWKIARK